VSLALVNPEQLKKLSGQELSELLSNPQNLNSYAYTLNNPIIYVDPDGHFSLNFFKPLINDTFNVIKGYAQWVGEAYQTHQSELSLQNVQEYANLSSKERSKYGSLQSYEGAKLNKEMTENMMFGMIGGEMKVARGFDAVVQQGKMLEGVVNSKAINAIKAVFKESDTIPGGTMGALRNEIMTGLKTKGIFHTDKAWNVINSIKNIFKTETLNSVEINRLQGIKNSLESLIKNIE